MFFGRNESGASVNIDNSLPGHQYFCPVCGGELIRKMGHINVHHFAHKSRVECDDWYDTKGLWHRSMQAKFKEKFQEVPVVYQGKTHIADVRFPRKNALPFVIEFQESPIRRTNFMSGPIFTNAQEMIFCGYLISPRKRISTKTLLGNIVG